LFAKQHLDKSTKAAVLTRLWFCCRGFLVSMFTCKRKRLQYDGVARSVHLAR